MTDNSFTTTFTVDQTPAEVFAAINNVRGWWGDRIDGMTNTLGAEFVFAHEDIHRSVQRITDLVPYERVEWHVVEGYLSFTPDATEWTGTDIMFEIVAKGDRTQLRFTHVGLSPAIECFDTCSNAWAFLINTSLHDLIVTGVGQPLESQGAAHR